MAQASLALRSQLQNLVSSYESLAYNIYTVHYSLLKILIYYLILFFQGVERAAVETVGAYLTLFESDGFHDGFYFGEFQCVHVQALCHLLHHSLIFR